MPTARDLVGAARRAAPRRPRRWCPRRPGGSWSGAGCRGGPGAARCRAASTTPPATLVPPMSMPMASGPQPRGASSGSSASVHRDRSRRGVRPRPGGRAAASVAGVAGPPDAVGGAARAGEVGEHRRRQAGQVGEPGEGLGAQRAHDGRAAAQRAPRGRTGRAAPRAAARRRARRRRRRRSPRGPRRPRMPAAPRRRPPGRPRAGVGGLGGRPAQALEEPGRLVGHRAHLLVPALSAHWPTAPRRARSAPAARRCPPRHSGRCSAAAPTAG